MSFSFVGNARIIETVNRFISAGHIPHAIIIEGDEGTGRKTLANYIAKAAVCLSGNSVCDNCKCCRLVDTNNHPDIIYIAPEERKKNISVAQIRTLRSDAYIKPHMQGKKVFIINKAETLNEMAQNALLKTLEEPPANVLFILITESSSAFLDTIISRCVCLSLLAPSRQESIDYIKAETGIEQSLCENAVDSARNNIGKALVLLGRNSAPTNALAEEFAAQLFDNAPTIELLKSVHSLEKDRIAAGEFVSQLRAIVADKIRLEQNNAIVLPRLIKYYDTLSEMQPHLITNINLSLFFTSLISKLK